MRRHQNALPMLALPVLAVAALVTGGCGSTGSARAETTTCAYEFEANVHQGPSAPFQTRGLLVVANGSAGDTAGVYRPIGATNVDDLLVPDVSMAEGNIELGFHTPGGVIEGSGVLAEQDGCVELLLGDLTGPVAGDVGDWDGVLIDGKRVELHTVERHPAPSAGAAATEAAIGAIDIGPEPEPTRDPELEPSSLEDIFNSAPRVNKLGNILVDGSVNGTLEEPPFTLEDVEPRPFDPQDCPDPEELGDGDCIQ